MSRKWDRDWAPEAHGRYDKHHPVFNDIFGGGGGGGGTTVNTGGVSDGGAAAAAAGERLGNRQIDESTRQYNKNMEIVEPVVKQQMRIADETAAQGKDYFDYMKTNQRPVEGALKDQAMKDGTEQQQQEYADRAIADSRRGYTAALNTAARQGLRYGFSPSKLAAQAGQQMTTMATAEAAAANAGREKSINQGFARKLDVAGLYRGLPGASTGAYGMAVNAGNSAVNNSMAPGQQLLGGMAQGAGMIQSGLNSNIQAQNGVLNANVSMANAQNQRNDASSAGAGQLLGTLGGMAAKAYMSSKQVKHDKEPIDGEAVLEAINDVPVEKWTYNKGKGDDGTHVGPYAEDVHKAFGEAAAPNGNSIDPITMNGIALAGIQALTKRLNRLESHKYGLRRAA